MSDNQKIRDELVARAKELAPKIAARAAQAAMERKPADESIQELVDAGLISMFVPRRFGGAEAPLSTMMDVVEIISSACPSTGWIASFYMGHNIYVAKFPEETQQLLWGKRPYVLMPAATAPKMQAVKVEGGWQVSGRASWASGIMHADWVMMSGLAPDGPRAFIMPRDAVEMADVWHFTGMAGTGSNDVIADGVFVPDHLSLTSLELYMGETAGSRIHSNKLYGLPLLVAAYCTILPVLTGTLRGAYAAYLEGVERRVRNFTGAVVKEQPVAHLALGEHYISVEAASRLARDLFRRIEGQLGYVFTQEDRLEAKGQTAFISKLCRETVNAMMAASGASAFHESQMLQRIWRDLNTVSTHIFWDWDVAREMTGRMQLGLPVAHPLV